MNVAMTTSVYSRTCPPVQMVTCFVRSAFEGHLRSSWAKAKQNFRVLQVYDKSRPLRLNASCMYMIDILCYDKYIVFI